MTYNDRCPPRYEVFKLPTSPIIRAKDFSQAHPHYSLPVNPLLNQQSCLTLNKPAQTLQTVKWLSRALRRILYAEYAEDPFRLGRAITVISMNAAAKHRQIANTAASRSSLQRTSNATWAPARHHLRVTNSSVLLLALRAFATNPTPVRTLSCVT
jgi:hypothetical protein